MSKHSRRLTKKRILIIIFIFLLAVCTVLYKLADRYLIEHVEISNALDTSAASDAAGQASQSVNTGSSGAAYDSESVSSSGNEWNYTSDSKTINIKKITEGSGSDTVTYYVADIVLKDSSELKSAFAKNQFGSNIIEYTSEISEENNAILAINGDYYGFRDDGIVIRNGEIFRDIPARTGLAFYENGTMTTYDETGTTAEELISQGVTQTLSFGPVLVKASSAVTDFGTTEIDTNFGNRSIQNSNPRTGVGVISANHYVFVVVDGRSKGYSKGMTLTEFAQLFESLGCTDAYNLDGGGSSTMYFNGEVINNPLGKNKERGVSDILYIG
ncbi:exopolysaccharide biosynthesis protein [Ruminiclostridium sufflavum DSM 19573]|uniref:Exopolysaccharide biosynthesis protein n=2 Tax=Ruminiclostridium TaxID=1508657 RepID=A0A318Y0E5_9FIRM|nr:exopolysaccharide biosynthesis protein [Ruminiclostridium sufflavum DSM 19573]